MPQELNTAPQHELKASIEQSKFSYCIHSLDDSGKELRWPVDGWVYGSIDDIAYCIEAVSLTESLVTKSTQILELGVEQAANVLASSARSIQTNVAKLLCQTPAEQTNRMACAIVANAFLFHARIEGFHSIPVTSSLRVNAGVSKLKTLNCWSWILDEVNYWPIFKIAVDVLDQIPALDAAEILNILLATTDELISLGATGLNDLSGRMFQKLISDRKFLATFYTLPVSATFLAEMALSRLNINWNDVEAVKSIRVADFACGTGALIGAVYHSLAVRFRRNGNDDGDIHAHLLENSLFAFDIMPAATHLTASTLSNMHPQIDFASTRIVTMPYGRDRDQVAYIGSLELLKDEKVQSLLSLGRQQLTGRAKDKTDSGKEALSMTLDLDYSADVHHESLDIVVMNPPFTRPTNHAKTDVPIPSFAGFNTTEEEQHEMSSRLRKLSRELEIKVGNGYAGLASHFVDLAHIKLKPGGILGLILPATFAAGHSWRGARKLLREDYQDVTVVALTSVLREESAFSADTGMAEVMVVAQKKVSSKKSESKKNSRESKFSFINLGKRPSNFVEAYELAKKISKNREELNTVSLILGKTDKHGIMINSHQFNSGFVGLTEPNLANFMLKLSTGKIWLPRTGGKFDLPVVQLGELGKKGLGHRSLIYQNAPFDKTPLSKLSMPTFPTLWSHNANKERKLVVAPDCELETREGHESSAVEIWKSYASKLHINLDFRLTSQSLAACLTKQLTLGGTAWPNFILNDSLHEIAILLWFNTTIGLMSHWWTGSKQHDGRSRITISVMENLISIDPRNFSEREFEQIELIFNEFRDKEFLPAYECYRDSNRIALDQRILVDLLGMPEALLKDFEIIRKQWCNEPKVRGSKLVEV